MVNMENDLFLEYPFGRVAIRKMKPTHPNFRLFQAEWDDKSSMIVRGAVFDEDVDGSLCIINKDTIVKVVVSIDEINEERSNDQ